MTTKSLTIDSLDTEKVTLGANAGLVLIAGPCVIENRDLCFTIADTLRILTRRLGIGFLFKASFDKANRSSLDSFRGPGLEQGLEILAQIRREFAVPVVSDIHLPSQATPAAEVLDVLQIPAFLARQTDLLVAAARTGKCLQVKKAQFMAPWDMKNVIHKITASGNDHIIIVERGSSFGYNRLICDMTAIPQLQQLGCPTLIDATHATQQPGGLGHASGGSAAMAPILARAAVAAGADGIFLETHPDPPHALSDAACMLPLDRLENLLACCRDIYHRVRDQSSPAS